MTLDYFYGQSGELFAYFRIPKALFQDSRFRQLSTDARTLYGILLDRMSLSVKNNWLDEQGRVYIIYTVREVQESLCCAEHKAVKLFRELEQTDLIERKRRGLGRPSLIYVKNFSSGLPKAQVRNCANSNSCAAENAVQVQPKAQSNKTEKNKTERNNPFFPDETDRLTQREQLEDYFYQALEVELLLRLCPDDEDTIYQIVDLLVDTCSAKRKMLRVAGDDKPTEVVRSRLKKLNADHIRFVLGCLAENTSPVRNMKQYLLAALFNAPTTMLKQNIGTHTLLFERLPALITGGTECGSETVNAVSEIKFFYDQMLGQLEFAFCDEVKKLFGEGQDEAILGRKSLPSVVTEWMNRLDPSIHEQLFADGTDRMLQLFLANKETSEHILTLNLAKLATDLNLSDWDANTQATALENVKQYKMTAEKFRQEAPHKEAEAINGYQLTYEDEAGCTVTKRFDKVETSKRGKLLYNAIESAISGMGQAVSEQEKRQILMDVLRELC